LHFVGASTRPGNGVPLVLMGVKVVAEAIMKEQSMA
jgi:phytoene desaturase (3,4-didehydrolycopene-forming)